jgi:hypothetical protein
MWEEAYLEVCKIDPTDRAGALRNMDFRNLGKGTGDHAEAQQEAKDLKEMHDVLFGWASFVLRGGCEWEARRCLNCNGDDRKACNLNRVDKIPECVRRERELGSTKTDFGQRQEKRL